MSTNLDPQLYEKENRLQKYIQYDWEIDLYRNAGYVNYFAIVENQIKINDRISSDQKSLNAIDYEYLSLNYQQTWNQETFSEVNINQRDFRQITRITTETIFTFLTRLGGLIYGLVNFIRFFVTSYSEHKAGISMLKRLYSEADDKSTNRVNSADEDKEDEHGESARKILD